MAFDAIMLSYLAAELHDRLTDGRIDKIHQPERDEIVLAVRAHGGMHRLLINAGSGNPRLHLSETTKENPPSPPMFCILLRKHIGGAKITAIEQLGFERVIRITLDTHDEMGYACRRYLIAEMMGKFSNLILTDEQEKILGVLKPVDFTMNPARQVLPGMRYELPPPQDKEDPRTVGKDAFLSRLAAADDRPCDKWITASYLGISALSAREMVFRASGRTDTAACACDPERLWRSFSSVMEQMRAHTAEPMLVLSGDGKPMEFSPFCILQYGTSARVQAFDACSEMIEHFFETRAGDERRRQRAGDIFRLLSNAEERLRKKIAAQKQELSDCDEGDRYKLWGDMITSQIYKLERGMASAELDNYYSEDCEKVTVPLDTRLTPAANAQRYYKKYAKSKTARRVLTEQIATAEQELEYLYTVFDALTRSETEQDLYEIRAELYHSGYASRMKNYMEKKMKPSPPMKFMTDGGYTVLVGRNNAQNDQLTMKTAAKTDWWFHAKNTPGAHAILLSNGEEPAEQDFTQAAMIAAFYSKAAESARAEVDYTLVKNIRKPSGAKPGFVTYGTNYSAVVTPDKETVLRLRQG